MSRTTVIAVQTLLDDQYNGTADLQQHIDIASAFVDAIVTCMTSKGLTAAATLLELIERIAACYYYRAGDPGYSSRSTANKSGAFTETDKDRFYNRLLTLSGATGGCLGAILKGNIAFGAWLGKTVPEQLSWEERN